MKEQDAGSENEIIKISGQPNLEQESRNEDPRTDIEKLSGKGSEPDDSEDIEQEANGNPAPKRRLYAELERKRRLELIESVHKQFRVAGSSFHFKDQPDKIAFRESDNRMVSAVNDERVTKAIVKMAEAKGWQKIRVSGHPEFRRAVWFEASLRGLEVSGYKPTEQELKELANRMKNVVEKNAGVKKELSQEREETEKQGSVAPPSRAYEGRVLDHGPANYNHDPDEKPSYFVTLATENGEKTVWGVDLKRAMEDSRAKTGDDVTLEFKGKQPVTVEALKRDKDNKVIGSEQITTNRNTWEVQKSDRYKVVEALASKFIDSRVQDQQKRETLKTAIGERLNKLEKSGKVPSVLMYDKSAPTQSTIERSGPQVEHTPERTR